MDYQYFRDQAISSWEDIYSRCLRSNGQGVRVYMVLKSAATGEITYTTAEFNSSMLLVGSDKIIDECEKQGLTALSYCALDGRNKDRRKMRFGVDLLMGLGEGSKNASLCFYDEAIAQLYFRMFSIIDDDDYLAMRRKTSPEQMEPYSYSPIRSNTDLENEVMDILKRIG